VERNRRALDTVAGYAFQQHLTPRVLTADELFDA
jgi:hypothetical protein